MPEELIKVLLVEDTDVDAAMVEVLLKQTTHVSFDIARAATAAEAQAHLSGSTFDVILSDLNLPDTSELQTFRAVSEKAGGCPIVILTSIENEAIATQAVKEGAQDYLYKAKATSDGMVRSIRYAIERQRIKSELADTVRALQKALGEVRALRGLLPICSYCKKVRDDEGYWSQVEVYISERSDIDFTHGMCPPCHREHFPEVYYNCDPDEES